MAEKTMKYDPKLREAMAEIEQIIKKYDVGGFVALISPTHGEYKNFFDAPSWSNIRFLKEGKAAHIRLHIKSDPENTNATTHMLYSLRDMGALLFKGSDEIAKAIENHCRVDHTSIFDRINNDDRD